MFKMSYGLGRWRQYCPIGGHLKFFCGVTPKNAKTGNFLHIVNLSEILLLHHISRVPPCVIHLQPVICWLQLRFKMEKNLPVKNLPQAENTITNIFSIGDKYQKLCGCIWAKEEIMAKVDM